MLLTSLLVFVLISDPMDLVSNLVLPRDSAITIYKLENLLVDQLGEILAEVLLWNLDRAIS